MLKKYLKKNLKFILAGLGLLILFYGFSFLVKEDIFTRFDFDMTVRIQAKIPIRLDAFLSWFSLLGSFEVTLVLLALFSIIRRRFHELLLVGIFGFMHVVELVGKAFLDHPGTPFMFHRYALDFFFPTSYVQPGGSYPSGHAMRTAYITIIILVALSRSKFHKNMKIGIWCLVLGIYIVMIISRISLGEHWTSDVIGGSLLGAAFAVFSLILL